jgi:hypothetical protein
VRWLLPLLLLTACGPGTEPEPTPTPAATPSPTPSPSGPALELPHDAWSWCPGADAFDGSGDGVLRVGEDALYCGTFDETRTLSEDLDAKALLRFVAGTYALPLADLDVSTTLPVCAQLVPDEVGLTPAGPGALAMRPDVGGSGRYRYALTQPLDGPPGPHELVVWLEGPSEALADGVDVQGVHLGSATDPTRSFFAQLCEGTCADFADGVRFDSCTFFGVPHESHRVTFDGGEVTFDLRIGQAPLATQPGIFLGGVGELDGAPFDVRDYWSMAYALEHHHTSRDFLLRGPGPCGLVARHLDPWGDAPAPSVQLVDCDGTVVEERDVLDDDWSPPGN